MIKIISLIFAIVLLLFVIELVRRERLTFKYAFGWIAVCVLAIILGIFDQTMTDVAHRLGFELLSNFIFFALLSVMVFLSLLMTIFLCQQNNRNDAMAQKISLLELEIKELKKKNEK